MSQRALPFPVRLGLGVALAAVLLLPASARAAQPDPYGDCCVAQVTVVSAATWEVTCGRCATNPGRYVLRQPDPDKLVFVGPNGETAASRYEAAQAICHCPAQNTLRAKEKNMDKATDAVSEATALAEQSGGVLHEILELAEVSAQEVAGIAAAAEQQSSAAEQINKAMTEVSDVVEHTSTGMHESAAAVHALADLSGDMEQIMGKLRAE